MYDRICAVRHETMQRKQKVSSCLIAFYSSCERHQHKRNWGDNIIFILRTTFEYYVIRINSTIIIIKEEAFLYFKITIFHLKLLTRSFKLA